MLDRKELEARTDGNFKLIDVATESSIVADMDRLLQIEDQDLIVDAVGTLEVLLVSYLESYGFKVETHTYDVIRENNFFRWYYLGYFDFTFAGDIIDIKLNGEIQFEKYANSFWILVKVRGKEIFKASAERSLSVNFPKCIVDAVNEVVNNLAGKNL